MSTLLLYFKNQVVSVAENQSINPANDFDVVSDINVEHSPIKRLHFEEQSLKDFILLLLYNDVTCRLFVLDGLDGKVGLRFDPLGNRGRGGPQRSPARNIGSSGIKSQASSSQVKPPSPGTFKEAFKEEVQVALKKPQQDFVLYLQKGDQRFAMNPGTIA
ncbi:hypothetical protein LguiA_017687 [Lonicera macranthoides]